MSSRDEIRAIAEKIRDDAISDHDHKAVNDAARILALLAAEPEGERAERPEISKEEAIACLRNMASDIRPCGTKEDLLRIARLIESTPPAQPEGERYREALEAIANQDWKALLAICPEGVKGLRPSRRNDPNYFATNFLDEYEAMICGDARTTLIQNVARAALGGSEAP